jgi:hypothetical protein
VTCKQYISFVAFVFLIVHGLRHLGQHGLFIFMFFLPAAGIFARALMFVYPTLVLESWIWFQWAISELILACFGAVLYVVWSVPYIINEHHSLQSGGLSGRAVKGVGLRELAGWNCGFESQPGHGYPSVVSVVCCQVEVSVTSWSLVQMSPTDRGAPLCDLETLMRRPWPTGGFRAKIKQKFIK